MTEVAAMKTQLSHLKASFGARPFISEESKGLGLAPDPLETSADMSLPLKLGPIGSLASGRVFDSKIAGQSDF